MAWSPGGAIKIKSESTSITLPAIFRQISLLALQVALQHLVNVTMQAAGHGNSPLGFREVLRHLFDRAIGWWNVVRAVNAK
jgi:hypothetical protein